MGLPQYKDTFFEARVDGRVLNVLTVEDLLIHMKITNLLHHLSIRRGIQVKIQLNKFNAYFKTLNEFKIRLFQNLEDYQKAFDHLVISLGDHLG